jgi:hypothetical protein
VPVQLLQKRLQTPGQGPGLHRSRGEDQEGVDLAQAMAQRSPIGMRFLLERASQVVAAAGEGVAEDEEPVGEAVVAMGELAQVQPHVAAQLPRDQRLLDVVPVAETGA